MWHSWMVFILFSNHQHPAPCLHSQLLILLNWEQLEKKKFFFDSIVSQLYTDSILSEKPHMGPQSQDSEIMTGAEIESDA